MIKLIGFYKTWENIMQQRIQLMENRMKIRSKCLKTRFYGSGKELNKSKRVLLTSKHLGSG